MTKDGDQVKVQIKERKGTFITYCYTNRNLVSKLTTNQARMSSEPRRETWET